MSDTSYTARRRASAEDGGISDGANDERNRVKEDFSRVLATRRGEGWQKVQNVIGKWNASGSAYLGSAGGGGEGGGDTPATTKRKRRKGVDMLITLSEAIFGSHAAINSGNSSSLYLIVHYLLRLAVLVLCLLGCFVQIGTIMSIFFNYPAIVFVDLHPMEKLLLPSMTICNDNRVMRSKLTKYDEQFAREWSKLVNKTETEEKEKEEAGGKGKGGKESTGATSQSAKLVQQQLIDNLIRTMLSNLTVSQFMAFGITVDDFLDVNFFKCASDKSHPTQKCILLSNLLTTAQENGNCFTLFHRSSSTRNELNEIAIKAGLSESAVVRGSTNESVNIEMSLKPFAPNEIVRFRVNFQEEEYTTLNEPVSGRFIIHDNREIAVVREKSYRIEPGKYYIFYLTKETDELLEAPYFTDCRKYNVGSGKGSVASSEASSDGKKAGNKTVTANVTATATAAVAPKEDSAGSKGNSSAAASDNLILLEEPSSKSNCILTCISRKTIATCNCWPPELPFLYTGSIDNGTVNGTAANSMNSLHWCDWREKPPIVNASDKPNHLTWFQYCFNTHEEACNAACKPDCSIDRYRITKEEIEWPSKERIERSEEKDDLKKLAACCAVISIRYWTAEQKINKYKPRFEVAEFTSYIGGLLSMWLGFSLFGFYGLSEKAIVRLVNSCLERRRLRAAIKRARKAAAEAAGADRAKGNISRLWEQTSQRLVERSKRLKELTGSLAASPLSIFGGSSPPLEANLKKQQTSVKQVGQQPLPYRASNRRKPVGGRSQSPLVRQIQNWRSIY